MKKQLPYLICFILALLSYINVQADSVRVDIDNLRYTVDTETNTAEVYGLSSSTTINNLIIPDYIDYNGSQIPVTSIKGNAFSRYTGFSGSLTIGNNVQTIGNYAFYGCSGFTGSLILGNSVQSIGEWAFNSCSGFTGSLTIPNSVQTIGDRAFGYCSGFTGALIIGDNVQTIGESAFWECSGFSGSLTIPNSVQTIGNSAFYKCSGFTGTLTIPNSVQTIGNNAFSWCSGFTGSLTIPNSVQTIGSNAFYLCKGFTGSLTIPNSVQTIGEYAFSSCSGFNGDLIIGESVTTIGNWAFLDCSGFTGDLILGKNVETIGVWNFFESIFRSVTSWNPTPPILEGRSFDQIYATAPLKVPVESINLYKNADKWKNFYNIQAIGTEVPATGIELNVQDLTLTVGQTDKLIATVSPENTTDQTITWKSDNEGVATVAADGTVTAVSVGTANITATCGTVSATCKVTVTPVSPTSIELNIKDMVLYIGQSETLQAIVRPPNTTNPTVTWSSDNEAVATVSAAGKVVGISEGTATITASCGEVSATCKVTVNPIPASNIEITTGDVTLTIGSTTVLAAKVSPDNTTHPEVAWSSSDPNIASIAADGTVTAKNIGTAIITAKCGNVSATCKVTVIPVPSEGIVISPTSVSMLLGDNVTLTATVYPENTTDKNITWGSDNPAVASVSSSGVVTALSIGTATITASNGSSKASCAVTVNPVVATSISLNVKDETIFVASTTQLVATISPANVTDKTITWTSSRPEIATVDDQGLVYGVSVGTTTVTAKIGDVSTTCQINVVHRIPDMDPSVTTSDRDIKTMSGMPVNMAVYAEGGEPTGWSYVWTRNGEVVSQSSELNIIAKNETGTVMADTYRVKVENEIDKVVILSEVFDFVVQVYPAISGFPGDGGDGEDGNGITISTGNGTGNKTREGNTVTLSVATPKGGNPQGWEYVWSANDDEIGEGETIETVAAMSDGFSMAVEECRYEVELTNFSPDGDIWGQFGAASTLDVYRRPETPLQLLRKGDGTSHTFIAMMPVSDAQLEQLEYGLVYGYTDASGNDRIIDTTPLRYCRTSAEIYNNPSNRFWVYSVWNYEDGSVISSGLRYLDGSVDEGFDASTFDGGGTGNGRTSGTRTAVYTIDGQYMGTSTDRLAPGIYIRTTESDGVRNSEKIIIR